MKILGIETSCDEIAAAVVEDGRNILSNEIASSVELHKKTQGVVPEIAARDAAEKIIVVVQNALKKANCKWDDIDMIAVTNGPGLAGSLLVGIETARTLAYLHKKPLIPVHHIIGHIFSNLLQRNHKPIFPAIILTVSGGHNDLVLWKDYLEFELLGETLDDAAGEAFDKVAKMLDLGFPGGPAISKIAEEGDPRAFDFPRPMSQSSDYNFSYSGLKTAVLYELKKHSKFNTPMTCSDRGRQYSTLKQNIAASFEEAIVDSLIIKLKKAMKNFYANEIYLAGGVSANKRLRKKIDVLCKKMNKKFYHPSDIHLCTDNAVMIASVGYWIYSNDLDKIFEWKNVKLSLKINID